MSRAGILRLFRSGQAIKIEFASNKHGNSSAAISQSGRRIEIRVKLDTIRYSISAFVSLQIILVETERRGGISTL